MKLIFPKVWFAAEKLMNNQARLLNFSDRGSLHFDSEILEFTGRKQVLRINKIVGIDLISPRIPWISISYSFVFGFVILGFIFSRMPSEFHWTSLFIAMPVFSIALPFAIFAQKAILWVEITFLDDEKVPRRAYFLNRSNFVLGIFGSLLDDTLKMYKELRSIKSSAG